MMYSLFTPTKKPIPMVATEMAHMAAECRRTSRIVRMLERTAPKNTHIGCLLKAAATQAEDDFGDGSDMGGRGRDPGPLRIPH